MKETDKEDEVEGKPREGEAYGEADGWKVDEEMGKVDEGEEGKEKEERCGEEGNVRKQEGQGKKGA
eukprot:1369675-Prorocentrum_lima.AAC.1